MFLAYLLSTSLSLYSKNSSLAYLASSVDALNSSLSSSSKFEDISSSFYSKSESPESSLSDSCLRSLSSFGHGLVELAILLELVNIGLTLEGDGEYFSYG
jgi:hypothetical protein